MCPAQIYCSVRAMSRIVWAQLQLIKDICTYRINSGGAPEVMPHCAQSYLTSGWLKSWGTVVWGWLGSEIPWGYSGHLPILLCALWCPPVLFMGPTHQMSPFKHRRVLLSSAFCVCKHSQLISLASVWGIIFWQALYYIQLLYLHMTPHWALKFSCPLDRGKDEFLVHISHISLLTITASWMARTSFFLELIHSKTRDQGEKTHDSW